MPELRDGMPELRDGMPELRDGMPELRDGMPELRDGMPELRDGMPELRDGMPELRDGMPELRHGRRELRHGRRELRQGGRELRQGGRELRQGGRELRQGGRELRQGGRGLRQGGRELRQGGRELRQGGRELRQGGRELRHAPGDEAPLPIKSASHGILGTLLSLTAAAGGRDGGLVLIDEPDNGLHPSAIRAMVDAFREIHEKEGTNIVLATHSPVILNAFGETPEDVWVTEQRPGATFPVRLTELCEPEWLANFRLGNIYGTGFGRQDLAEALGQPPEIHGWPDAPTSEAPTAHGAE